MNPLGKTGLSFMMFRFQTFLNLRLSNENQSILEKNAIKDHSTYFY